MITHSEYFYKKSLYFNELARFGQFIEYTLLGPHLVPIWPPFLLLKVPIWSPFHSKSGPHLVPILKNLGPHSMWEQWGVRGRLEVFRKFIQNRPHGSPQMGT